MISRITMKNVVIYHDLSQFVTICCDFIATEGLIHFFFMTYHHKKVILTILNIFFIIKKLYINIYFLFFTFLFIFIFVLRQRNMLFVFLCQKVTIYVTFFYIIS